ncbi:MAG: Gfo/Idh/MocA family oxidoreductase [Bacteriovorax sp.]|nr:Gfo/Idh/MocA family oxidoreductase [Bacteriovorax sp.]
MNKFLVVGLGSMGKRRIRCLQTLGYKNISGFDPREDRKEEAKKTYNIDLVSDVSAYVAEHKPHLIISVPPHLHNIYMKMAVDNGCHFFVEASVLDDDFAEIISEVQNKKLVAAPSCTLFFHPAIQLIKKIVEGTELGKLSNWLYHSGQYLPDWHPYEKVADYYVSRKDTSGGREIVPFELSWLCRVFDFPESIASTFGKTIVFEGGDNVDDTYNLLMKYRKGFFGVLTVDVVSRYATRRMTINGQDGQLRWDWEHDYVELYTAKTGKWEKVSFEKGAAHAGYNPNIAEDMYVNEIKSFMSAVENTGNYPTDLTYDWNVLKTLYKAEKNAL